MPANWFKHSVYIVLTFFSMTALGQEVKLLKDISPEPNPFASSNPHNAVRLNDSVAVFMSTTDGLNFEFWRTNGQPSGTYKLMRYSGQNGARTLSSFKEYKHEAYFLQYTEERDVYLWKTDGTVAGTKSVARLFTNAQLASVTDIAVVDDRFYFRYFVTGEGYELYYYDLNTGVGSHILYPGSSSSNPTNFVTTPNYLYCTATSVPGSEQNLIVRVSPQSSGFTKVQINIPTPARNFYWLAGHKDVLYVCGYTNSTSDIYLWTLDAVTGAVLSYYKVPSLFNTRPLLITADGGAPLYRVRGQTNYELHLTNSSGNGYYRVTSATNGRSLTLFGGEAKFWKDHLYLPANDGSSGTELFRVDPKSGRASMVADLIPSDSVRIAATGPLEVVGDKLFFIGADILSDRELYVTDGTASGTKLVKNIRKEFTSNPSSLIGLKDKLVFVADDGIHGRELWVSDGNESGTQVLKDINKTTNFTNPSVFTQVGDRVIFKTQVNNQSGALYVTDGTEEGTVPLLKFDSSDFTSFVNQVYPFNGEAFVTASDGKIGEELWKTNGKEISLVKDINLGSIGSFPAYFTTLNNDVYFTAISDIIPHTQVYKTAGTAASTKLYHNFWKKYASSNISNLVSTNDLLFATALTPETGYELLVLDPYEIKPPQIIELCRGSCHGLNIRGLRLFAHKNLVYFDGASEGLFRSDGTPEGTYMLIGDHPAGSRLPVQMLDTLHGKLFFLRRNESSVQELWKTDGTIEGTELVKPFTQNTGLSLSNMPVATTSKYLYFFVEESNRQIVNLMRTDGTLEGTEFVHQIWNDRIWRTLDIEALNDTVYFMAASTEHGAELWKAGPKTRSSQLVADINPGEYSSNPMHLTAIGNRLYFAATHPDYGTEVYYLEDPNFIPPTTGDKEVGSLTLYPNPTSDRVIVRWQATGAMETTTVGVYDLMGKKVKEVAAIKNHAALDLAGYASGVYVVRVQGVGTVKVVKQ